MPVDPRSITYTLRQIQAQVGGVITGDPDIRVRGVNALDAAGPGELTFADTTRLLPQIRESRACAIIVPRAFPPTSRQVLLRVDQPRLAFVKAMYLFQLTPSAAQGVDRTAVVSSDATLGGAVTIKACAVVCSKASIGKRTVIESGAHIGEEVSIGEDCLIGPNVVIMRNCKIGNRVILHAGAVIGADGFGFVWDGVEHVKVPQVGNVVIEDDVELGANVCVDRATMGSTIIKRGTKVDNLVQIAHNDLIGEHVIICGQAGFAGSVKIGNGVIVGGQVGIADHLSIGDGARLGAGAGVIKDVQSGETVWWFPARPIDQIKRELAALTRLPDLLKQRRHLKPRSVKSAKRKK